MIFIKTKQILEKWSIFDIETVYQKEVEKLKNIIEQLNKNILDIEMKSPVGGFSEEASFIFGLLENAGVSNKIVLI